MKRLLGLVVLAADGAVSLHRWSLILAAGIGLLMRAGSTGWCGVLAQPQSRRRAA